MITCVRFEGAMSPQNHKQRVSLPHILSFRGGHLAAVDASPILRDFNHDGCTDILWFSPHLASSPLWTARCNGTKSFSVAFVTHPDSVYPLGFGLGHGRP